MPQTSMQVQSLIFDKKKFSRAQAVKWAKDHDFSAGVDETGDSYRMRQEEPGKFKTMRTITMTEGVKAVVGKEAPIQAVSPELVAKELHPELNPIELFAQVFTDNDGYLGGTIRYGSSRGSMYPVGSDNEEGHEDFCFGDLTFDIDDAKEMCDGIANADIEVNEGWSYKINVDEAAAVNSTSENPVIVAQIPTSHGVFPLLIDGHHRHYRARMDDENTLPAYLLTVEQTLAIIHTHPDMLASLKKNARRISESVAKEMTPEMDRAKATDLVLLPPGVMGTNCANCRFAAAVSGGLNCTNPSVDQMVNSRMCCALWDAPGTGRAWEYAAKAQPTLGGVHVPSPMKGKTDKDEEESDPAAEEHPVAPPSVQEPGWEYPPENNDEVGFQDAMKRVIGKEVKIRKFSQMKQIAYGVVLEPDTEDLQGDVITAEEIERTAHDYMTNIRKVGARHKAAMDAVPVESYIAPMDLSFDGGPYGSSTVKKGSWVLGVKVNDPAQWKKVMNGEYSGFSIGGVGVRDEL